MLTCLAHRSRVAMGTITLFTLAGLPGCGNNGDNLPPVEGRVMLGDNLLATSETTRGTVALHPDAAKGNLSRHVPQGRIDHDGHFKIMTNGVKTGAAAGWYKVTVDAAKIPDPKNPYHTASGFLVSIRYIDKETTDLGFEVVANPPEGAYDLKLQTR